MVEFSEKLNFPALGPLTGSESASAGTGWSACALSASTVSLAVSWLDGVVSRSVFRHTPEKWPLASFSEKARKNEKRFDVP
jgi:hypothetical protein